MGIETSFHGVERPGREAKLSPRGVSRVGMRFIGPCQDIPKNLRVVHRDNLSIQVTYVNGNRSPVHSPV